MILKLLMTWVLLFAVDPAFAKSQGALSGKAGGQLHERAKIDLSALPQCRCSCCLKCASGLVFDTDEGIEAYKRCAASCGTKGCEDKITPAFPKALAKIQDHAPPVMGNGNEYTQSFDDGTGLMDAPPDPGVMPNPPAELAARSEAFLKKSDADLEMIRDTSKKELEDVYAYCDQELAKIKGMDCDDKSWDKKDQAKCKKDKAKAEKFCANTKKYSKDREQWIALAAYSLKRHDWDQKKNTWDKYQERRKKRKH